MSIIIESAQYAETHWQVLATVEMDNGSFRGSHIIEAPEDADEETLRALIAAMYKLAE